MHIETHEKNARARARKVTLRLESLPLHRAQVQFPTSTWQLPTTCNSRSRVSSDHCGLNVCMNLVYTRTYRKTGISFFK